MSWRDLEQYLLSIPRVDWRPGWFYNKAGDQIEVLWDTAPYYAKWVNHNLTLYLSQDDHRVVGCVLTQVSQQL